MKINNVLKNKQSNKFCFVAILTLLLIGCIVQHLPEYEIGSSEKNLNSISKDGVYVAI